MKIKAYTSYSEANKIHRYREFEVIDILPEIGEVKELFPERDGERTTVCEIRELSLDCEQGNDEVYNYKYYEIVKSFEVLDDDDNWVLEANESDFVALEISHDDN